MTTAARRGGDVWLVAGLIALAGVAWTLALMTMRSGAMGDMSGMGVMSAPPALSLPAFMVAWVAMMAAMMVPAVAPVVRLYWLAARRGTAAPAAVFLAGYLAIWFAVGLPVFVAYNRIALLQGNDDAWAGRAAGAALVVAAVYTFTPLKAACLQRCRSPLSLFMALRGDLRRPRVALRASIAHGAYCLGCCWALMAVLVTVGVMSVAWMIGLTLVIFIEKALPGGREMGRAVAAAAALLGALLLAQPALLSRLI